MSNPSFPEIKPAMVQEKPAPQRAAFLLACWGTLSLLCFLAATVLVGLNDDKQVRNDWRAVAYGFGFGVVSLSALWAVLGPFRLFTRVPLALLLAILACGSMAVFLLLVNWGRQGEFVLLIGGAGILQWLGLILLLIPARLISGLRVGMPGTERPMGNQAVQFGIRQMLFWTTGVALTLGAARLIFWNLGLSSAIWDTLARDGATVGLLLAFNMVLACPVAWALLHAKHVGVRMAIAALIVGLATLAEFPAFSLLLRLGPPDSSVFWWINGAGTLCLGVNLLIVRLCGYRLMPEEHITRSQPGSSSYPGPAG